MFDSRLDSSGSWPRSYKLSPPFHKFPTELLRALVALPHQVPRTSMSAGMRANFLFNRYVYMYLKFAHVGERVLLLLCCVRSIAESSSIPSNRALHSAIAAIYDLLGIFKGNELNLCTISRFLLVPLEK
jgi:hypothetical protein